MNKVVEPPAGACKRLRRTPLLRISDGRLRGPGIAKLIARKRSIALADIVAAMTTDESLAAVQVLEVPLHDGDARATLNLHLTGASWRRVRKAHADFTLTPETLQVRVLDVIDGDTIRVELDANAELVRLRGIDAPESRSSDKVEADLDRAGHDEEIEYALGERATARLAALLVATSTVELHVERRADRSIVELRGHRVLAYVSLANTPQPDVGLAMLESGHALVWPRNLKSMRYHHPRVAEYLRACNAAFHSRPGLWSEGLARHCPAVQAGMTRCSLADCERTCSPSSTSTAQHDEE